MQPEQDWSCRSIALPNLPDMSDLLTFILSQGEQFRRSAIDQTQIYMEMLNTLIEHACRRYTRILPSNATPTPMALPQILQHGQTP